MDVRLCALAFCDRLGYSYAQMLFRKLRLWFKKFISQLNLSLKSKQNAYNLIVKHLQTYGFSSSLLK